MCMRSYTVKYTSPADPIHLNLVPMLPLSSQVDLAVHEKEHYVNVTRWFDHLQHYPRLRHHLCPVVVLRNRVYISGHH